MRVLCNPDRFNLLHIRERGELIEHERVHMIQFQGYFKELHISGIAIDDLTRYPDHTQLSTIGVTELWAQSQNTGSNYEEDYVFVLAAPDGYGGVYMVKRNASTQEAWEHLHRDCGDPAWQDPTLRALLEEALWGDAEAYQQLDGLCSLPIHRLIPDRWRE